jgi:hypothetical protein
MKGGSLFPGKGMGFIHPHHNPLQQEERAAFTLTLTFSRKRIGIIHPHLNPLPSRERKIKENVFPRRGRSGKGFFIGRAGEDFPNHISPPLTGGDKGEGGNLRVPLLNNISNYAAFGRLFLFHNMYFARNNAERRNTLQNRQFCFT